MKKVIFLFFISSVIIFGQKSDTLKISDLNNPIRIDSIKISGNEITQDFIILRELNIAKGDIVGKKKLQYNRERVYSLGLFNYVNFYIIPHSSYNELLISVFESWYIYPIPFLFFHQGDLDKATYGINLRYENFRGRNETINAFLAFGYDPTYSISYYNPVFISGQDISFNFEFRYQDFSNKSYNAEKISRKKFDYRIVEIKMGLGKRINQYNDLSFSGGYEYIEAPNLYFDKITASANSIDRFPFIGIDYIYDTRDLKQFPKNGIYTQIKYYHKGFNVDNIAFNTFRLDFREYQALTDDLTARWRLNYRKAFGRTVPYYDYSYLGYDEYIRGHKDDYQEGLQYLMGSLEMSYSIIKEWDLSLDLPIIPKRLTSARIGINLNIFTDTGLTFDTYNEIKFNNFYSGYGVGINILLLPYNTVRIEYAFDEYKNGEWLIGTGFSF